jgi:hypothetical protein
LALAKKVRRLAGRDPPVLIVTPAHAKPILWQFLFRKNSAKVSAIFKQQPDNGHVVLEVDERHAECRRCQGKN